MNDKDTIKITAKDIHNEVMIENYVCSLGYMINSELDCIHTIKNNNISLSGYTLPYGCRTIDEWEDTAIQIETRHKIMQSKQYEKLEVNSDFLQRIKK